VIEPYNYKVDIFPDYPGCFTADSVYAFNVPYHPQTKYYMWDFGDPLERGTGRLPASSHTYKAPGIYTVYSKVQIGTCIYDSILCKKVKLYGPIAKIFPVKGLYNPWDSVPPNGSYLITPSQSKSYFDTSCLGSGFAKYYTYASKKITNGEAIYDPCKADTVKTWQKDSLMGCNGKKYPNILTSYVPHVKGYKDTIEQVPSIHFWSKGNPIPTGNIYSDSPFVNRPWYMDDTSLFSLRCKAPQLVSFTNFSVKYRGYNAVDNFAPGYPDKCKNPVYPYASDSLTYLWDFGEGSNLTSTKNNPNATARYSNQKLPTHLFRKNGCYWVMLTVTDSMTNCMDRDSVPVVLQAADAGWAPEYGNIKNMTNLVQDSLPANGPRRGMIISGRPCVGDTQFINLKETLPGCYKRQFSMVLDSVQQVIQCKGLTKWDWFYKDKIEKEWAYHFYYSDNDTGWKTVGLVISNNYNCYDTVWYHNYKYIHAVYPAVNVATNTIPYPAGATIHVCPGETLKMSPIITNQPGIQRFMYLYAEELDQGDTVARFKNDTIRYRVITHLKKPNDSITSTVHNKLWGIDDASLNFNNLTDTTSIIVPKAGHFTIISVIKNRWGCTDTARRQVTVGHYADFNADNNIVCVNDTAHFEGLAQYFLPFYHGGTGYDSRFFWRNPDSVRQGRKTAIPELMQWDLDGDGIIDYTGSYPSFIYKKPGSYTVTMYTRDSSGCIQKLTRPDFVKVIDAFAYFSVAFPGETRYCSGSHFFTFVDSSYVIKPFKDSLNKFRVLSWTWDFGDSTPPLYITDTSRKNTNHVYISNGDYKVTLTVRTALGTASGCKKSFSRMVHILGPTSHFSIVGPHAGCVPFTLKVRDESRKATVREWILGDGSTDTSRGDTFVYLTYKKPGVFCPQFFVADTLIDLQGRKYHCEDSFPAKCSLIVVVYDTNKQVLSVTDTLVCAGREPVYFKSVPDTGYKSWTIHYGNGDSATNTVPRFSYLYKDTGRYRVVINGAGAHCPDTSSVNVHVIDIKAGFEVDAAKKDTPVFSFINKSVGGVRYTWDFGDGTPKVETASPDEISHEFQKAGTLNICLTAYNSKGCADSVCHPITIDTFIFIPNVFTPNGDGWNNHYVIPIYGNLYYDLDIFNRWGQKIFHSNDKHDTWDGMNHVTGTLYPEGAYYAVLKYRFIGGRTQSAHVGVTLLRK
jgi:gliding motility-associated-like protein